MKALRHDSPAAQRRDLRIALEQLRQAVRDVNDIRLVDDDQPVKAVLARLVEILAASQAEVAGLLGVSTRQLQRWLRPEGPAPEGEDALKVRVAAGVSDQLRHTFTGPGVLHWFNQPHPRLGRRPSELLEDPLQAPTLLDLALSARSQGA